MIIALLVLALQILIAYLAKEISSLNQNHVLNNAKMASMKKKLIILAYNAILNAKLVMAQLLINAVHAKQELSLKLAHVLTLVLKANMAAMEIILVKFALNIVKLAVELPLMIVSLVILVFSYKIINVFKFVKLEPMLIL